jgi:hypothetical protein
MAAGFALILFRRRRGSSPSREETEQPSSRGGYGYTDGATAAISMVARMRMMAGVMGVSRPLQQVSGPAKGGHPSTAWTY